MYIDIITRRLEFYHIPNIDTFIKDNNTFIVCTDKKTTHFYIPDMKSILIVNEDTDTETDTEYRQKWGVLA